VTAGDEEDRVGVTPAEGDGHDSVERREEQPAVPAAPGDADDAPRAAETFIGPRGPRWRVESVFVRTVATSGIVGISVALAAILGTQGVAYWITGLVVSLVSVVFAAVLW